MGFLNPTKTDHPKIEVRTKEPPKREDPEDRKIHWKELAALERYWAGEFITGATARKWAAYVPPIRPEDTKWDQTW